LENLYLTVVDGLQEGVRVLGNAYPVSWAVEFGGSGNEYIQIYWPESQLVIELKDNGNAAPGTPVQLCKRQSGSPPYQLWTLRPCEHQKVVGSSTGSESTSDTVIDEDEHGCYTITTTTNTTTVTKISRRMPFDKAVIAEPDGNNSPRVTSS